MEHIFSNGAFWGIIIMIFLYFVIRIGRGTPAKIKESKREKEEAKKREEASESK